MKAQRDESRGRILLGDETSRRAFMLRPSVCQRDGVWFSTGFPYEHLTARILSVSTCAKFDLAPEGDYCLKLGNDCTLIDLGDLRAVH